MNETQRAAAERLADAMRTWPAAFAPTGIMFETAALLRELAAEPVPEWPCKCDEQGIGKPEVTCGDCPRDYGHKVAEPVQEPAIWIQSNHLQHAKNGPHFARTGPTKLQSDYVPLYTTPQQRRPLTDEQINRLDTEAIHGGPDSQYAFRFARAVEKAVWENNK